MATLSGVTGDQIGPTSSKNTPDSFINGPNVISMLQKWNICRTALSASIQSYLAVCNDLNAVCASAPLQSHARQDIEKILSTLDIEFDGLAADEDTLRQAQASLKATRNLSVALTSVHVLPPEILADVFFLAAQDGPQASEAEEYDLSILESIAQTSSYWRKVALGTPFLWSHISIAPHQRSYSYLRLLLKRSNPCPINLYIHDSLDQYKSGSSRPLATDNHGMVYLTRACNRVQKLDINVKSDDRDINNSVDLVLKYWISYCAIGVAKSLRVRRHEAYEAAAPQEWSSRVAQSAEHIESVLGSIKVLHLNTMFAPLHSAAYHNLVDLRLSSRPSNLIQVTAFQMTNILIASPDLIILALYGVVITLPTEEDLPAAVGLRRLQDLCVMSMSSESCELFLSIIHLPSISDNLSIHFCIEMNLEITRLLRGLICGVRLKYLFFWPAGEMDRSPHYPLSILSGTIYSEEFFLYGIDGPLNNEQHEYLELIQRNNQLNDAAISSAPSLTLVNSIIYMKDLKAIMSTYGIRTLYFHVCELVIPEEPDVCAIDDGQNPSGYGYNLTAALKDEFPEIQVGASGDDDNITILNSYQLFFT